MKKLFLFIIFLFGALFAPNIHHAQATSKAIIFYNRACGDCAVYADQDLFPTLQKLGIGYEVFDYIKKPDSRKDLYNFNQQYNVPLELQDSTTVFIDNGKLILEGHIPTSLINQAFDPNILSKYDKLIVSQPEMHKDPKSYSIQKNGGKIFKLPINEPIKDFLNQDFLGLYSSGFSYLTATVIGGLANSVHPCSIAILLFLISFLFSIKRTKNNIIALGLVYIAGIFLTYLAIGLGIFSAVKISNQPFFVAYIASFLLILLGLINLKDFFLPNLPIHLRIPSFTKGTIGHFMEKATLPAAFILGVIVGLCAFPCTGGIYTAIVTALATTKSVSFYGYLLLYNFLFVLPLIVLVLISGNKKMFDAVSMIEKKNKQKLHLINGILMILIGIGVYLWLKLIAM